MTELYSTRLSLFAGLQTGFEELLNYIPASGRGKYRQLTFEAGRNSRLIGEILARFSICTNHKIENTAIFFSYSDKGKPAVEGHPDMHFNISHSGDYVVCAVSNVLTGIDIERIRKINFQVAKRYFSDGECNDLFSLPDELQLDYFFTLWTIKESYLKAIGEGLALNLNAFTVLKTGTLYSLAENSLAENFHVRSYALADSYKMAVCSLDKRIPDEIEPVSPGRLLEHLVKFSQE
jgi:4'-phosphopantetheinyl transferase